MARKAPVLDSPVVDDPGGKATIRYETTRDVDELVRRAESMMQAVAVELGVDLDELNGLLPGDMQSYIPVACFTSDAVTQSTNEWGRIKLTFAVNGETKWAAMRATDFPGQRLAVVVLAAGSE